MSSEIEKLEKVIERVKFLLEKYEACRNNDTYLVLVYWYIFNPEFRRFLRRFIPYDVASRLTPPESIRRARAYIQNTLKMYPPTDPKILRKRRMKEEVFREFFGKKEYE